MLEVIKVPLRVRERVVPILDALPDGDRLCHLDFHPANVIADGAEMTVIGEARWRDRAKP